MTCRSTLTLTRAPIFVVAGLGPHCVGIFEVFSAQRPKLVSRNTLKNRLVVLGRQRRRETHIDTSVYKTPLKYFHTFSSFEWCQILRSVLVLFPDP